MASEPVIGTPRALLTFAQNSTVATTIADSMIMISNNISFLNETGSVGRTPLIWAVNNHAYNLVYALIASGADVSAVFTSKKTLIKQDALAVIREVNNGSQTDAYIIDLLTHANYKLIPYTGPTASGASVESVPNAPPPHPNTPTGPSGTPLYILEYTDEYGQAEQAMFPENPNKSSSQVAVKLYAGPHSSGDTRDANFVNPVSAGMTLTWGANKSAKITSVFVSPNASDSRIHNIMYITLDVPTIDDNPRVFYLQKSGGYKKGSTKRHKRTKRKQTKRR
jgi:hypothetical protein